MLVQEGTCVSSIIHFIGESEDKRKEENVHWYVQYILYVSVRTNAQYENM